MRRRLVIALVILMCLASEARAQAIPYAPSRLTLQQVCIWIRVCGIEIEPAILLGAYEGYMERHFEAFREIDAAQAPVIADSGLARGLVPTAREERTASQMRRRSLEHSTRLLDEFLDDLVVHAPAAQKDAILASRDELHARALRHSMPVGDDGWHATRLPADLVSGIDWQLDSADLGAAVERALATSLRRQGAERRAVAAALWRSADEARVRAAELAEQVGLSGIEIQPAPEDPRWQDWSRLLPLVKGVVDLEEEPLRAHYRSQLAIVAEWGDAIPRDVIWQTLASMQDGLSGRRLEGMAVLDIPIMLEGEHSAGAAGIVRTTLALPGLSDEQRRSVREEGIKWLEGRTARLLQAIQRASQETDVSDDMRALMAFDVACRNRIADLSGAAWLRLELDQSGRVKPSESVKDMPRVEELSLSSEDAKAVPFRKRPSLRTGMTGTGAHRRAQRNDGLPSAPPGDLVERAGVDLALTPGQLAVWRALYDDFLAGWAAEVEPRIRHAQKVKSQFEARPPAGGFRNKEEFLAFQESLRRDWQAVEDAFDACWRAAHDTWRTLGIATQAATPETGRPMVGLWVEARRADLCFPQLDAVVSLPMLLDLPFLPAVTSDTKERLATALAPAAPAMVDQLESVRHAIAQVPMYSSEWSTLIAIFGPESSNTEVDKRRRAALAAVAGYIERSDSALLAACGSLAQQEATNLLRLDRAQRSQDSYQFLHQLANELPATADCQLARDELDRRQARLDKLGDISFGYLAQAPISFNAYWARQRPCLPRERGMVASVAARDLYAISLWRIRNLLPPEVAQSCKSFERLRSLDALLPSARPAPAAQ